MFDKPVNDTIAIPPDKMPKTLYHYTTWAGAQGIISSQKFWATAHNCTNDRAELVAADEIIIKTARDLRRNAVYPAAGVLDLFLENYASEQVTLVIPVYLTCFSILRDNREQWRRYGEAGRGICLGVRILNETKAQVPELGDGLVRVDYSEVSWREKIKVNMGKVCSLLSYRYASMTHKKLALSALYRIAAFASIMAKQPVWEAEMEFRHVTIVHPNIQVEPKEREAGGRTIRYLPVSLRDSGKQIVFAEIITGPNQNVEVARERLNYVLSQAGYGLGDLEYPEIVASEVTPWESPEAPGDLERQEEPEQRNINT